MSTFLGILLVIVTIVVALALGAKANKSVVEYDEDKHELFVKGRR